MTILPSGVATMAGLNVPADSQVEPSGERMGVSEARCHGPNGRWGGFCGAGKITARVEKYIATKKRVRMKNLGLVIRCSSCSQKSRLTPKELKKHGSKAPPLHSRIGRCGG